MKRTIYIIGLIFILIISGISVANTSQNNIIYVDDNGGADYIGIQDVMFNRVDKNSYTQEYKEYLSQVINKNNHSDKHDVQQYIPSSVGVLDENGLMDSCWPMKSQNTHHTGLSPYSTNGNNGNIKWTYRTANRIEGGPVIDDGGIIYFGDYGGNLIALYPDGTLKWKYDFKGSIWSTPAIGKDGTIYIGTYGDSMYAMNPDGTLKWEYLSKGSISSSPAIGKDGTIYFGTMGFSGDGGCSIICLYLNGTLKWDYQTGYKIVSDPAIGDDGTIYIGSGDHYLYAMNPNGTLKWRFKTGDIVKSHPSIAEDGTIYFDSFDDYLYALNPDGTLKWKFKGVVSGCGGASIDEEGIIYIGGRNFDAIYPNGTRKWRFNFGDDYTSAHSSPAISSDGTIYIGVTYASSSSGHIFALDKDKGMVLWKRTLANDWVESSPCIGEDGTVYVGSSSTDNAGYSYGVLYAFGRNETNQPPNSPVITGPTRGQPSQLYTYNFIVNDPDLDSVELKVEWGDGSSENWIGPYDSGSTITLNHFWYEEGNYAIHAKARDTYDGSESSWSTLSITMPKLKTGEMNLIDLLFDLIQRFLYPLTIK